MFFVEDAAAPIARPVGGPAAMPRHALPWRIIMLGFLIGTACLIGLFKVARGGCHGYRGGGRCGSDYGDGSWGPPWRRGRHGSRGFGPRFFLRSIFERLETTPGQEKVILQAADELRGAFGKARSELRDSRSDFARVFRGDAVDEAALSELFLKHDTVISATRRTAVEAVRKAHEALTEEQRSQVADFIERGRGGWDRGPRHWM
jgi:Spy/CpxP family protein refolding chaperone